jgi:UDP-glucose:(heptosyl)LPS alpha-1,3-glucosyltransferase
MERMKILYIVRTFGSAGGMERYVFENAREIASRGHNVSVLCRTADEALTESLGIEVVVLQPQPSKRGWQDRTFFRHAVTDCLRRKLPARNFDVIHSHENTLEQNVSTEHGPCTKVGLSRKPWKLLDYSAVRNLLLERAKLFSQALQALVSCSYSVQTNVTKAYPHLRGKILDVIPPAFGYLAVPKHAVSEGRTVGFIGSDWRRKGLVKAVEIFRVLKARDPRWLMLIGGVEANALPPRFMKSLPDGAKLAGRVETHDFFRRIDLLLHPAFEEPFGMVIGEALSTGVPAVISDQCGCLDHLEATGLRVLDLRKPAHHWALQCEEVVSLPARLARVRSWSDVADDHEGLYARVIRASAVPRSANVG